MFKDNTREKVWMLGLFVLIITGLVIFLNWRSNLIISEFPDESKAGDKLSGPIKISKEKISDVSETTPALISLSKEDKQIISETTTLEKILESSEESPKFYTVKIEKIVDYTFEESGEYELILYIPEINFVAKENFNID